MIAIDKKKAEKALEKEAMLQTNDKARKTLIHAATIIHSQPEVPEGRTIEHHHWQDDNGNITDQERFNFKCSGCGKYQHSPVAVDWTEFTIENKWCHWCGSAMDEKPWRKEE